MDQLELAALGELAPTVGWVSLLVGYGGAGTGPSARVDLGTREGRGGEAGGSSKELLQA